MASQEISSGLSAQNVYTPNRAEQVNRKESAQSPAPSTEKGDSLNPKDVLTISENSNIDYALFNYLGKGGDASDAVKGKQDDSRTVEKSGTEAQMPEKRSFAIRPDFRNISASRYNQVKSEIEQSFSDDPASKGKYLSELDKAREDYEKLQEQLNSGRSESEKEDKALLESSNTDGKEVVTDKLFGKTENKYDPETSKVVDDFLLKESGIKENGNAPKSEDPLSKGNPILSGMVSV